jgi:hypothetical protein
MNTFYAPVILLDRMVGFQVRSEGNGEEKITVAMFTENLTPAV